MNARRMDVASIALFAGAAITTGALWAKLPAQVPVHFNLYGDADGWMPKAIGAWILLLVAVPSWALVRFGGRLLPTDARDRLEASPTALVGLLVSMFMVTLHFLMLKAAFAPGHAIGGGFLIALGAFFAILGLVLPRVRRNPFIGIRTAWTLCSDENWARTHRLGGTCFVIGGAVAMASGVHGGRTGAAAGLLALLATAAVPVIYSFVLARRVPPQA